MTKKIIFLLLTLLWVGQLGMSQEYDITLKSNNDKWGTAKVVEPATEQSPVATIQASIATIEVAFEKWSDGVAQNPRTVVLDKDTVLTAIFIPLADLPKQKIGDLWYRLIPASHTAFVIRNTADPYTQTEIDIPASVKHDGEEYAVTMLNDSAFYNCKKLKSVTIPESVKRIASRVFYGCSSLTSVEFPENLNIIGAYAFGDCEALSSITLPKSMTGLGWGAFRYCSNLTSISIKAPVPPTVDEMAFANVGAKSINVPCGTKEAYEEVGNWKNQGIAIVERYTITVSSNNDAWGTAKVEKPATCESPSATISTRLGSDQYAFVKWSDGDVTPYRTITVNKDIELTAEFVARKSLSKHKIGDLWYKLIPSAHTALVAKCGDGKYEQEEINIPASVEFEGEEYAVTVIEDSVFMDCLNLLSVTIPNSVTRISPRAFKNCLSLENVKISENASYIGAKAFEYCRALKSITIPKGTVSIGYGAFEFSGLETISIENPNPPTLAEEVFMGTPTNEIKVPCGSAKEYSETNGWKSPDWVFTELPIETVIDATIIEGENYTKNGFDKNEAGTYAQHLESANGCDSIVTLRLSVMEIPPMGFKGKVYGATASESAFATIDELESALEGNTIVAFDTIIPTEWAELPNVVVNGEAKSIKLSSKDGPYTYDSEINAESAEFYLYHLTGGKFSTPLTIPFTGRTGVTLVNTLGNEWSFLGTQSYSGFEFVSSDDTTLLFKDMDDDIFEANVPYFISYDDFIDGRIEVAMYFFATNTIVQPGTSVTTEGDTHDMKSVYNGETEANAYIFDRTKFTLSAEPQEAKPFTAYAVCKDATKPMAKTIGIAFTDGTDAPEVPTAAALAVYAEGGDIVISASKAGTTSVYSIGGQMMRASVIYGEGETRISGLGAGTYVVAGRKVVLK